MSSENGNNSSEPTSHDLNSPTNSETETSGMENNSSSCLVLFQRDPSELDYSSTMILKPLANDLLQTCLMNVTASSSNPSEPTSQDVNTESDHSLTNALPSLANNLPQTSLMNVTTSDSNPSGTIPTSSETETSVMDNISSSCLVLLRQPSESDYSSTIILQPLANDLLHTCLMNVTASSSNSSGPTSQDVNTESDHSLTNALPSLANELPQASLMNVTRTDINSPGTSRTNSTFNVSPSETFEVENTSSSSLVLIQRGVESEYSTTILYQLLAKVLSNTSLTTVTGHNVCSQNIIATCFPPHLEPNEESDEESNSMPKNQELIEQRKYMLGHGFQRMQDLLSSMEITRTYSYNVLSVLKRSNTELFGTSSKVANKQIMKRNFTEEELLWVLLEKYKKNILVFINSKGCEKSAQILSTIEDFAERLDVSIIVFNVRELNRIAPGIDRALLKYTGQELPMVIYGNRFLSHMDIVNALFFNRIDLILSTNPYPIYHFIIVGGGVCAVSALHEILLRPNVKTLRIAFVDCLDRSSGTNSTEDSTDVLNRGQAGMVRSSLRLLTARIKQLISAPRFSIHSNRAMQDVWRSSIKHLREVRQHFMYSFRKLLAMKNVRYYRGVTQFLGKDVISVSIEHQEEREITYMASMNFLVCSGDSTIIPRCVGNQYCLTISEYLATTAGPLANRILIIGNTAAVFETAYMFMLCGRDVTVMSEQPWLPLYDEDCAYIMLHTLKAKRINFVRVKKINAISMIQRTNRTEHRYHTSNCYRLNVILLDGHEDFFEFDLILSDCGDIPIDLGIKNTGAKIDPETGKVIVDEEYESSVPSISVIGRLAQDHPDSRVFEEAAGRRAIEMCFDGIYKDFLPSKIQPSLITTDLVYASVGESEETALTKYKQNTRVYHTVLPHLPWSSISSHLKKFYYGKIICLAEGTGCSLSDPSEYVVGVHLIGSNSGKYIEEFANVVRVRATKPQCRLLPCMKSTTTMGDLWRNLVRKVITINPHTASTSSSVHRSTQQF